MFHILDPGAATCASEPRSRLPPKTSLVLRRKVFGGRSKRFEITYCDRSPSPPGAREARSGNTGLAANSIDEPIELGRRALVVITK